MTIAAILAGNRPPIITADGSMKVADAISLLAEKRIGALPVIADGQVAGIFSERDVIYCLQSAGADALDRTVGEVMTAPAVTVGPSEKVFGALSLMTRRRIRHLPVIEEGVIVGFVSIGDLVKYRIDKIEEEAAAMREYIQSA